MQDWTPREHYTAEDLVEIIRILRDGENGCPWDKVQTHASIRKNFLEETCEALEAIDADDPVMMQEELGDVLMQVVFHTVIEEERGRFDMEKVCRDARPEAPEAGRAVRLRAGGCRRCGQDSGQRQGRVGRTADGRERR